VHYNKIVQIVEVKGAQTEQRGDRRLQQTVPLDQFILRAISAQAQIRRHHHAAEEQKRFGEQEQQGSGIESRQAHETAVSSSLFSSSFFTSAAMGSRR
jgi:hypothetical protein